MQSLNDFFQNFQEIKLIKLACPFLSNVFRFFSELPGNFEIVRKFKYS